MRRSARAPIPLDWVRPHRLESEAAAPHWTTIGTVGSARRAIVDPRGLVTPWADGWSLDWWIGGDDRWYVPSREPSSRITQRLVDGTPVVETALRIPSGEAVHRAYAVAGADDLVIVEIENRSRVPFAVALAVRPYNPEGRAPTRRIESPDRTTITVDRRAAMLLPRPAARVAASTFAGGDSAAVVMSGAAGESFPARLRDGAGMAQAAVVYPLPHTATLRVALPLERSKRARAYPASVPSPAQVARGWVAHSNAGPRFVLPDERLQAAVEANQRFLLLFGGTAASPSRPPDVGRLQSMLESASPTWTWNGHDPQAASDFVSTVRDLLVVEGRGAAGPNLALCSTLPTAWWGRNLEVHDVPTRFGPLSFAVRWHGERPALLWEIEPHDDVPTLTLTAPGLDRSWSTNEPRGEALLAPVPAEAAG